jgi:hypothetical protein
MSCQYVTECSEGEKEKVWRRCRDLKDDGKKGIWVEMEVMNTQ